MILTAHQPSYLPWLGFFHKLFLADAFVVFDDVPLSGDKWEKRNRVKMPDGQPHWLTVPVHAGRDVPLKDVRIDSTSNWQRKHWKTIEACYRDAPYWDEYAPIFAHHFNDAGWDSLADMNVFLTHGICRMLKKGYEAYWPRLSQMGCKGEKSELVLDMCLRMGADTYIFGELGADYCDVDAFRTAGVEPVFQDYQHPTYPQIHGRFQSHLSVIDLLFNCGPDSYDIIMAGNMSREDLP